MTKKTKKTTKEAKATASGKAELTETQLDEVSGGPHFVSFTGLERGPNNTLQQKVRKPVNLGRFNKV